MSLQERTNNKKKYEAVLLPAPPPLPRSWPFVPLFKTSPALLPPHTPQVLAKQVDEQLQPLAELVAALGGSVREVLLQVRLGGGGGRGGACSCMGLSGWVGRWAGVGVQCRAFFLLFFYSSPWGHLSALWMGVELCVCGQDQGEGVCASTG